LHLSPSLCTLLLEIAQQRRPKKDASTGGEALNQGGEAGKYHQTKLGGKRGYIEKGRCVGVSIYGTNLAASSPGKSILRRQKNGTALVIGTTDRWTILPRETSEKSIQQEVGRKKRESDRGGASRGNEHNAKNKGCTGRSKKETMREGRLLLQGGLC